MNIKKQSIIMLCVVYIMLLSSCRPDQEIENLDNISLSDNEKQEFFIETRLWSEIKNETIIEKVWQVRSTQDIEVSSQAAGRIVNVFVRKWQKVRAWHIIAELQDTSGNIVFWLERADVWLERAIIQKDSTLLSLENQLFDIEVQINNADRSLMTLKNDREKNIRLLEDSVKSSDISTIDSTSSLQLAQFDANIERLELDYETQLISDTQTRQGFIDFFRSNENTLRVLMDDVIDFADPIFSVTEKNRFTNSQFSTFLWARNSAQRQITENTLRDLIELRKSNYFSDFRNDFIGKDLSDEDILEGFLVLSNGYELLRKFIPEMNQTFINTIESAWQLSSVELNGWKAQTQAFQSTFSGNYNAYINTQNQASTFLKTYKNIQNSQKRAIELQKKEREILVKNLESWSLSAEIWKDRTLLNIDDQIASLKTQINQLQNTKETTEKNIEITKRNLDNAIREAEVWKKQSSLELSKLIVRAPISGVIEDVFVDIWQEISPWIPVVSMLADSTPELQVSVSEYERNLMRVGQEVYIDIGKERYRWIINALSEVADSRFNYSASIVFSAAGSVLGNIARVSIPVENDVFLLPIRLVEPIGDSQWRIATYKNGNISQVRVRLWRVFWDNIEIIWCAQDCQFLDIIWNDISNFNSNDFILRKK